MEKVVQIQQLMRRFRRMPLVVMTLTLAVLAGVIALTTLQVRQKVREQIAGRDGEVLQAVALMEYAQDVEMGLAGPITDPGNQLNIVLKSSQLKGVLGVRLFDPSGRFVEAFPPYVREANILASDLPAIQQLKPVSHFRPAIAVTELFYPESTNTRPVAAATPLLVVNVPLHLPDGRQLAGIAQFLLEGQSIAAEFARLDRHLALQAAAAFGVAGAILLVALGWAFRRLRQAHRLLAQRSEDLLRANEELALAAKTSALGTVTAHLIHGLKNPLAGLQTFISAHEQTPAEKLGDDWQQALASTRRMQTMINQVVSVLHEEKSGVRYEVTTTELGELLATRVQPLAKASGVEFKVLSDAHAVFPNRVASLVALILENLVHNALQATPRGKAVLLRIARRDTGIAFEVQDQGAGFPNDLKPFAPCRSSKDGGTGIGLALSKQLANHLGASLEMTSSTADGCVFVLVLPESLAAAKSNVASAPVVV